MKKTGVLPEINPIVDLYNAVSILYAVPVGGENLDAYVGEPCLTVADGTESFETMANGEPAEESPTVGEVIWARRCGRYLPALELAPVHENACRWGMQPAVVRDRGFT